MLSVALQIHRNILSAQCYIRYVGDSDSVNTIQVECYSSKLRLLLLMNDEIVKKVKITTPNDFFIPSSLTSDSDFSVKPGSAVVRRTTVTPARQSITECSFRLHISGEDQLDQSESELKVKVKDFFKERFKNVAHWNLFCANCGVDLPVEPLFIKGVREYAESELSEGWFCCHGKGPQTALQPSSQILYLDDTSFYLYLVQDWDINCKVSSVLDKKCNNSHEAGHQEDGYISVLSTSCSGVSHSDSTGINCSSKSAVDCSDTENIDQSIIQGLNSFNFSTPNSTSSQKQNHLTALNLNRAGVKNQNELDPQVLGNSVNPNSSSSCLKQAESSIRSCTHYSIGDYKHSNVDKNEYLNGSKVLNPVIECQSCGNVLTSEKPPIPFTRFYLDKIMFKNSSFDDDHLEYARKIALLSFWSLVTRSQTSLLPSKLFLQSKIRGEELCLLLWIPCAPLAQFLLQDSLDDIPPEINLKTEPVYKVLYFIGTSRSENVRSWRHDFDVDFYHVSDTMLKMLTRILDTSSGHLSETSGAGGFSCGFLTHPLNCYENNKLEK